ncbi:MBG domain-containing protein, partial [Sphingobacterium sp. UT-1RO-CII-1]|uniref:MBG domain-containing protein n=1 Tax=Sphingobacterium sp. UT-1RO-CII-1 TaxID=2995225 RepID=UPI00227B3507
MNRVSHYLSIIMLLLTFCAEGIAQTVQPDAQRIIYVNKNVIGSNGSGDSWANAIPELAHALKWANANKTSGLWSAAVPLKIYVAKGTYKPMYTPQDGKNFSADAQYARDRTFLMVKDVELYGGFDPANGKTALTDRILPGKDGTNADGTILSGDLNGDDAVNIPLTELKDHATRQDNAYHVVLAVSGTESVAVKLDGFGITGGNANHDYFFILVTGRGANKMVGGGICSYSSSVTLSNSSVYNNSSSGDGGGIYSYSSSSSSSSSVTLSNSSVYNNISSSSSSSSSSGGGIYSYSRSSSVTLSNSSVYNNSSSGNGGGIYSYSSFSTVTLSNSSVYNNSSRGDGGGIYSYSPSSFVSLSNSSVYNNSSSGNGGGISSSSVTLSNSSVYNNRSSDAGSGIYSYSSSNSSSNEVKLNNSTLAGNTGTSYVYFHGGGTKKFTVRNSLVYGNAKSTTDNSNSNLSANAGNISKDIQYSLVQDIDVTISADPGDIRNNNLDGTVAYSNLFMDAAAGDYALANNSPAIDAGSNALYDSDLGNDLDLAGNPRLSGCKIDIGAYENQNNQGVLCFIPDANKILYVNKHVNGGNGSGDSWANAIPELADALKWANANKGNGLWSEADPLKIYVAKGTYKPMYTPQDGKDFSADAQYARDRTFLMVKDVELYGGFDPANGKTALTDRILPGKDGTNADGTILSGDLNGDDAVGTTPGQGAAPITGNAENAYHVVLAASNTESVAVKLDGFGITGGNADATSRIRIKGQAVYRDSGGGVFSSSFYRTSSSSVTLNNSSVYNNSSLNYGGGIYSSSSPLSPLSSFSSVTLSNSSVYNNSSRSGTGYGGGIYSSSPSSSVTLSSSSVYHNSSIGSGGGIYSASSSPSSSVTLSSSSVYNNSSSEAGGGIYSSSNSSSSVTLSSSAVYNNSSIDAGGGICSSSFSSSSVSLSSSSVYNNSSGTNGGGISSYSYSDSSNEVKLHNSTLVGNKGASYVYFDGGTKKFTVRNSLIYGNAKSTTDNSNSTLSTNEGGIPKDIRYSLVQDIDASRSTAFEDIRNNNLDGTVAYTNLFMDAAAGDYALANNSPAIDAGSNALYDGDLDNDLDLAGNPRLSGCKIDIGAYENQSNQGVLCFIPDANKILYVNKHVNGGNGSGDSWANAIPELANALKWASANKTSGLWSAATPLKIYVAKGTYKPMYTPEDGKNFSADVQYARDRTFLMVKDVELYGGFDPANGKTALTERILPGKDGTNADGTILSGDLNGDDAVGTTPGQGAAGITGNEENVYHVIVAASDTESVAVKLDGFGVKGGNANGSISPILVNGRNTFRTHGGGIFSFSSSSSVTLSNSSVYNNSSSRDGGGIYSSSSSSVTLSNSSIYNNNSSGSGGGISSFSSSSFSVTLSNSSVYNNRTGVTGGGIFSFSSSSASVTLSNSSVYNNRSSGDGGGIFSASSSNEIKLYNSSLAGNKGPSYVFFGGSAANKFTVYNSLVYGNAKSTTDNSNSTLSTNAGSISKDIQYSLVQDIDATISVDPGDIRNNNLDGTVAYTNLFMDAAAGDYSLQACSPAVNAGSNSHYAGLSADTKDLAGNPRVYDFATGGVIDIGAYEFQGEQINYDNVVFEDLDVAYNGSTHMIIATNLPQGVTPSYKIKDALGAVVTEAVNVGTYTITATLSGCGPDKELTATLKIEAATLTVTAASGQGKVYGDTDPVLTYTVSGYQGTDDNSILSGALSRTVGEDVGVYPIGQGDLSGGTNYDIDFTGADFAITQATLTVTANSGQGKVYGDTDPVLTYTVSGYQGTDDNSILSGALSRTVGEDVGVYPIGQGTFSAGANYAIDFAGADFAIAKATLTVTAASGQGKVYGEGDPVFTYTVSGYQGTDDNSILSGALSRTVGEDVGDYPIGQGDLSGGANYDIDFTGADFAIAKATLTVTAASGQGKVYGEGDPVLIYTVSGYQGTDDNSILSGALSRTVGENVGDYPIGQGDLSGGANYAIDFTGADFAIAKAMLTGISFDDTSFTYDGTVKSLIATGLPAGTTVSSYANNGQTEVGEYVVKAIIDGGRNYENGSQTAKLTITKAVLPTFTFADASFVYDGMAKSLKATGFAAGATVSSYTNNDQTEAGEYTVTAVIDGGNNYEDGSQTAKLTITKAVLPLFVFADANFVYDGTAKSLKATGLAAGATVSSYTNNDQTEAGEYTVTATIDGGNNYEDGSQTAKLTITKASIAGVTFADASFTYDGTVKSLVIAGALPVGAKISYENNKQTEAGEYTVTAVIDGGNNYEGGSQTAKLTITKAALPLFTFTD